MSHWNVLVARNDLARVELRDAASRAPLAEGEARLEVERFALTANNITYGAIGDAFGYWKFFPAQDGWGQIPVWGFARVVESRASEAPVGLRLFGYLPMSSHMTARLVKGRGGYIDAAPHRAELPPTYNAYVEAPDDDLDDHRALLRPLFMTSFLLDDFLAEDAGVKTLVLSSASSKTAMGLAWFARRRGLKVIGLTSASRVELLSRFGLYDAVIPYEQAARVAGTGAAYVDFAGDPAVTAAVHMALGADLARSIIVGGTHWQADRTPQAIPGPDRVLFFAPDQIRKRMAEWGPEAMDQKFMEALREFCAQASWLKLKQVAGPDALLTAYREVLDGRASPDEGIIIRPA